MNINLKKIIILIFAFIICFNVYVQQESNFIHASQTTIDSTINSNLQRQNALNPTVVSMDSNTGCSFYNDINGTISYSKTKNGGSSWSSATTVHNATD
jgi:hypothetical protein